MIKIEQLEGYRINPNDKVVNAILNRIDKNDGLCPCVHTTGDYEGKDLHCPCTDYKLFGKCCCNLYVRDKSDYYFEPNKKIDNFNDVMKDIGYMVNITNPKDEMYQGTILAIEYNHKAMDLYYVIRDFDSKKIRYELVNGTKIEHVHIY